MATGEAHSLGRYENALKQLASESPLAEGSRVAWLPPFETLFDLVRSGRNDAVHQGAYARSLADHAVQLALVLEDALMVDATKVSDFMVRDVTTAHMSQPLSAVRQLMLMRSFSFVPLAPALGSWKLLSDRAVARYLRDGDKAERRRRLALTIAEAVPNGLVLEDAVACSPDASISDALSSEHRIVLVVEPSAPDRLIGVLTPFDLL